MFKRAIHKLNYKKINIEDIEINFAKSYCKNLHITIKPNGDIYYVAPYFASDMEINNFFIEKKEWVISKSIAQKEIYEKSHFENITKEEKDKLKIDLENFIKKYEPLLNVKVEKFTIRKMRTLWGSCTYKKRSIRFNSNLCKKPIEFVEYIVLHEMSHIIYPNHKKEFYDLIKKYMPNYKSYEKFGKM